MITVAIIAITINVIISVILFFGLWSLRNEMAEEIEFIKKTTTLCLETEKELIDATNVMISLLAPMENNSEIDLEMVRQMIDNVSRGDIN